MGRLSRQGSKQEPLDDDETIELKRESSIDADLADGLSSARVTNVKDEEFSSELHSPVPSATITQSSRAPSSAAVPRVKSNLDDLDIKPKSERVNGQVSPAKPQTQSKTKSDHAKKPPPRNAPLFDYLPDVTEEAKSDFAVIESSSYQNKYLAFTESALECDCSEEWDSASKINHACGEDSDCINRVTKMECQDDCTCGAKCQNQRFSRRLWADVSVIQTDKKGFGLRTNTDLKPHDFIFEYVGEVIAEAAFRRRMVAYDQEGIKHFYFMSLSKGEFIDATKKGNLGRFCNHSCNPNCYVDKWVIGDKLRMGIFAEKYIKAGEELVFNYNVDRYGANPQPCYCGEANCTGFIGGKTQTERGTKLSAATIEALGIEDADDWDTFVAKKPKKKKTGEDDEDYVESVEAKALDADAVTKVMAALMQCKEKWIAVKLLQRIQTAEDELVRHRIVKLHGYRILNSQLSAWRDDENITLQILDILDQLPRLTRNKIVDSRIDQTLQSMIEHNDGRVASRASSLLDAYAELELAYRIPRKKRDEMIVAARSETTRYERREAAQERKRSKSRSPSPPRGPTVGPVPSGPRAQQTSNFPSRPPAPHRGPPPLPKGWFAATDKGRPYFYSSSGQVTWSRPTRPADQPPPPPKQPSEQSVLKSIIDNIVTAKEKEKDAKDATPETTDVARKEKKEERWKSYDEDKKKKLYENTLFPIISHVMNKYKNKIPRDDLKRFAKEIAKKLVASDFKAGRVQDPTKIDEKQQRKVKEFCKQFFDKAAQKHKKHEDDKVARKAKHHTSTSTSVAPSPKPTPDISPEEAKNEPSDDEDVKMSDNELTPTTPTDRNGTLKRKRGDDSSPLIKAEGVDLDPTKSPMKRINVDSETLPPPPPPPPEPPVETPPSISTPQDDMEVDSHDQGDTNFKNKSMADVLAQAQQEEDDDGDEEMLDPKTEPETKFEADLKRNGLLNDSTALENPLVDGQDAVEVVKREQEPPQSVATKHER